MIRVPVVYGIGYHHLWFILSDGLYHLQLMLPVVLEEAVVKAQVFAHHNPHYFSRVAGLLQAHLWGTAGTKLPLRKIYNSEFISSLHMGNQRTGAAKLNVIGVGGKSKYI